MNYLVGIVLSQICIILMWIPRNIFETVTQPLITNTYLKDGKVFKNAVHHVLFRQVLQFVYKIDHVFAHWRPLDFVNKTTTFTFGKFRFKFFNNLFTKATYFGGALNCHVFITLVPENIHKKIKYNLECNFVRIQNLLVLECISKKLRFFGVKIC